MDRFQLTVGGNGIAPFRQFPIAAYAVFGEKNHGCGRLFQILNGCPSMVSGALAEIYFSRLVSYPSCCNREIKFSRLEDTGIIWSMVAFSYGIVAGAILCGLMLSVALLGICSAQTATGSTYFVIVALGGR